MKVLSCTAVLLLVIAAIQIVHSWRTQYGEQSDWLWGQAESTAQTDAYYSNLRSALKFELTQLGFRQVSSLHDADIRFDLRSGDTVWKAPQDHFYAILSTDDFTCHSADAKTAGFHLSYAYFEHCWQSQVGRLAWNEQRYRASLQQWYRDYSIGHPITFRRSSAMSLSIVKRAVAGQPRRS